MKITKVLQIIFAIIALLTLMALSVPANGVNIGSMTLRYPTLKTILTVQDSAPSIIPTPVEPPEMAQLRDSIAYYKEVTTNGELRFWLPSEHYFNGFWRKAEMARQNGRVIRILHYGDSQIEMDRISSRLRTYMQETFGGGGPGMMSARTIIPSPAYYISAPGEMTHLASFGDSTCVRSYGNYGPMMQCFRMSGGVNVSVRTSSKRHVDPRTNNITSVRLVFNSLGSSLKASLDTTSFSHQGKGVSSFAWSMDTLQRFRVRIRGRADLYCLLADNGPGVAVDNIPMRGCSGQQFTLVDAEKLTAAYRQMDVGMIILQFGGNSVPYLRNSKSISKYCTSIGKQIDHLHRCCPNAAIVFVGPSDMSTRSGGRMKSYAVLPELIDSLTVTALNHNAAYWSIFHAMGGLNSMTEWHRQGLAGADYIHFSQKGADLMGDRMAEAFKNSYTLYRLERKMRNNKK